MKTWIAPPLIGIALLGVTFAQSTVLDASSYDFGKKGSGVNKCVSAGKRIIYTEQNCPDGYKIDDDNWMEKTNITHKTDTKGARFYQEAARAQQEKNQKPVFDEIDEIDEVYIDDEADGINLEDEARESEENGATDSNEPMPIEEKAIIIEEDQDLSEKEDSLESNDLPDANY